MHDSPADLAEQFVNRTSRHVFLTGKAGTGKTTFLRRIMQSTHKKAVIVAPTGIAAINAGGVTIHSFFQLPFGAYVPQDLKLEERPFHFRLSEPHNLMREMRLHDRKRQLMRELELLIIDEVSMLRADVLDAMDKVLRIVRRNAQMPFGGVQVLFIGDLLQLPPVVSDQEWEVLSRFYKSMYFFDARVLQQQAPLYIELTTIYRQEDARFIALLNHLRNNTITPEDVELLNAHFQPDFRPQAKEPVITLTTHNHKAATINAQRLMDLKKPSVLFRAQIKGEFPESQFPVDEALELKVGAQVMFIKNDPTGEKKFFNGKIGVVDELRDDLIVVRFPETDTTVEVERYEWQNQRFVLDEKSNQIKEEVLGVFLHYPIRLAWAITVHKSQGLTFDRAIIDTAEAFAPGQVYVALSRLRSLDGLILTSKINTRSLFQNDNVLGYAVQIENQGNLPEIAEREARIYFQREVIRTFDFKDLVRSLDPLIHIKEEDDGKRWKTKFLSWAQELREQTMKVADAGEKFGHQVVRIFQEQQPDYVFLKERIQKAHDYFMSETEALLRNIRKHLSALQELKQIKEYGNAVLFIEQNYTRKRESIRKVVLLTDAFLQDRSLKKEDVSETAKENVEPAALKPAGKKSTRGKKEKTKKEPKLSTFDVTFNLFREKMSVSEIVVHRGLSESTIENHLSKKIASGDLDVLELLPEDKVHAIRKAAKELSTTNLTPILEVLGSEYTYGDIRLALAGWMPA
jgi:hypothetical protein